MVDTEDLSGLHDLTLRIYYVLVKEPGKRFSPNDIKNRLNLQARSKAYYHLNRLYELNLVLHDSNNTYYIETDLISDQIFKNYVYMMSIWIPKSFIIMSICFIFMIINIISLFIPNITLLTFLNISVLLIIGIYHFISGKDLVNKLAMN